MLELVDSGGWSHGGRDARRNFMDWVLSAGESVEMFDAWLRHTAWLN